MFAQKLLLPALAIISVAAGKSSISHLPHALRLAQTVNWIPAAEYVLADAILILDGVGVC
jgi:hypothetical protein